MLSVGEILPSYFLKVRLTLQHNQMNVVLGQFTKHGPSPNHNKLLVNVRENKSTPYPPRYHVSCKPNVHTENCEKWQIIFLHPGQFSRLLSQLKIKGETLQKWPMMIAHQHFSSDTYSLVRFMVDRISVLKMMQLGLFTLQTFTCLSIVCHRCWSLCLFDKILCVACCHGWLIWSRDWINQPLAWAWEWISHGLRNNLEVRPKWKLADLKWIGWQVHNEQPFRLLGVERNIS